MITDASFSHVSPRGISSTYWLICQFLAFFIL